MGRLPYARRVLFFVAKTPCKYVDSKSKKLSLRLGRECIIDYIYCTIDRLDLSKLVSKHCVERSSIGTFICLVRACAFCCFWGYSLFLYVGLPRSSNAKKPPYLQLAIFEALESAGFLVAGVPQ